MDLKKLFFTFEASYPCDGIVGETLSEYIAERYQEVLDHVHRLDKLREEKHLTGNRFDEIMSKLDDQIKAMQSQCMHPATTFHDDTSGGNDSFSTCDVCGVDF